MDFASELKELLENAEKSSVGNSFGGTGNSCIFSVPGIRNWIVEKTNNQREQSFFRTQSAVEKELCTLSDLLPKKTFMAVVASGVRFSFLIELTNIAVTSTKIKTRWLPGLIQMSQNESYSPVKGKFEPGNDPRAASYDECLDIFRIFCMLVHQRITANVSTINFVNQLAATARVSYEFPVGYMMV